MAILLVLVGLLALQDQNLSADLLEYQPTGKLEGTLKLGPAGGFDSLLTRWAERMKLYYPDLRGGLVEPNLPPTPAALTTGVSQFGLMSRRWTVGEVEDARFYWGYSPTEVVVGIGAIAIVVNPNNPIKGILFDDLVSIYTSARRRGAKAFRTWGDLGVEGDWANRPINLHGLGLDCPAHAAFQEKALRGELFRGGVREHAGVEALLEAVAEDPCAIGYVSAGVRSDHCRIVPLQSTPDGPAVEPSSDSILSLAYPFAWRIYLTVRKAPGVALTPLLAEFLKLILSRDGQEIVAEEGLIPINGRAAHRELKRLKLAGRG